jgi:Tfp pilus assembly protein PilV
MRLGVRPRVEVGRDAGLRPLIRHASRFHRDEHGVGLVEALVSSALLGIALVALMASLSTFALASRQAEDRAVGQAFVRAQAARIAAAPYRADGDYSAYYETVPTGFGRGVTVTWWDGTSAWTGTQNGNGLQRVALSVTRNGSTITSLELAKAQR